MRRSLGGTLHDANSDSLSKRGLIPTKALLVARQRSVNLDKDDVAGGDEGGGALSSASTDMSSASGSGSVEVDGGGGGGDGGEPAEDEAAVKAAKKAKRNIFQRAAHKVAKRSKAAAEKVAAEVEAARERAAERAALAEAEEANSFYDDEAGRRGRHPKIKPGHEQVGDPVKVGVHGKDYPEWGNTFKVQELNAHEGPVWCLEWSQSGIYLASAGQDSSICIWKVSPPTQSMQLFNSFNMEQQQIALRAEAP